MHPEARVHVLKGQAKEKVEMDDLAVYVSRSKDASFIVSPTHQVEGIFKHKSKVFQVKPDPLNPDLHFVQEMTTDALDAQRRSLATQEFFSAGDVGGCYPNDNLAHVMDLGFTVDRSFAARLGYSTESIMFTIKQQLYPTSVVYSAQMHITFLIKEVLIVTAANPTYPVLSTMPIPSASPTYNEAYTCYDSSDHA